MKKTVLLLFLVCIFLPQIIKSESIAPEDCQICKILLENLPLVFEQDTDFHQNFCCNIANAKFKKALKTFITLEEDVQQKLLGILLALSPTQSRQLEKALNKKLSKEQKKALLKENNIILGSIAGSTIAVGGFLYIVPNFVIGSTLTFGITSMIALIYKLKIKNNKWFILVKENRGNA